MQALQQVTERNDMVVKYFPLVRATAIKIHRRLPPQVELDDLISVGFMGLIEAVDRFDPTRRVPLATFARRRVHGAIIDALRAQDWVPRTVRDKVAYLDDARTHLHSRLGRLPTRKEMASRLEMPISEYEALLKSAEVRTLVSIDAPVGEEGGARLVEYLPGREDPSEAAQQRERRRLVAAAMANLTPREREVICLYYFHDLSLREAGRILGVTESRVCQLCSRAVKRLRERMMPIAA
jgi:RNA polymerase sigma factor for flagellar operon FliA